MLNPMRQGVINSSGRLNVVWRIGAMALVGFLLLESACMAQRPSAVDSPMLQGSLTGQAFLSPGPLLMELAVNEDVARVVGVSKAQIKAISRLHDEDRAELDRFVGKSSRSSRKKLDAVYFSRLGDFLIARRAKTEAALAEIVGEAKLERLKQLQRQAAGVAAYLASSEAEPLKLTPSQLDRFRSALEEVDREVEVFRRDKERAALEQVLGSEQLNVLTRALGPAVSIALPGTPPPTFRGPAFQNVGSLDPPPVGIMPAASEPNDLAPIEEVVAP